MNVEGTDSMDVSEMEMAICIEKSFTHRSCCWLGTWRWLCTFNKMLAAENRMFCEGKDID